MSLRLGNTIIAGNAQSTLIEQPSGSTIILVLDNGIVRSSGGDYYVNISGSSINITATTDFTTSDWDQLGGGGSGGSNVSITGDTINVDGTTHALISTDQATAITNIAITDNGGTPALKDGITADEVRTLIGAGAPITVDTSLSETSTNPVQNAVVDRAIQDLASQIARDDLHLDIQETNLNLTFPSGGLVLENTVGGNLGSTVRMNQTPDNVFTAGETYKWSWTDNGEERTVYARYVEQITAGSEEVAGFAGLSLFNNRTSINANRATLACHSTAHPTINEIRAENGRVDFTVVDGQLRVTFDESGLGGGIADLSSFTTDDLTEGDDNLYYPTVLNGIIEATPATLGDGQRVMLGNTGVTFQNTSGSDNVAVSDSRGWINVTISQDRNDVNPLLDNNNEGRSLYASNDNGVTVRWLGTLRNDSDSNNIQNRIRIVGFNGGTGAQAAAGVNTRVSAGDEVWLGNDGITGDQPDGFDAVLANIQVDGDLACGRRLNCCWEHYF